MDIVTVAQIALVCVLAVVIPWQIYQRRKDFPSKDRYRAWAGGICVMLAGVAMLEAHLHLGYSDPRLQYAALAAICVGVGAMLWGQRGYKPKSN